MDTPAGSGQQQAPGEPGRPAGRPPTHGPARRRSAVLGSLVIPGSPEHAASARAFIARTLSRQPRIDSDAATLLTSEVVTNAIQHTRSGDGGEITVVVIGLPGGVLIEVTDQGSPGAPVVKGNLYAAEGHGLYLVQQLADRWGYLRGPEGTTVWFSLADETPLQDGTPWHDEPAGHGQARATASIASQIRARSPSGVTYGGIV
ncbi:MAG: ATP-binding protein [Nocardiopsaceae bacterium]|nr:ATP-binding protein [Nocardiopsaceae bacterium]